VGGSIGVAVLAVILQREIRGTLAGQVAGAAGGGGIHNLAPAARAKLAGPVATAFAHTYTWSLALLALALVPALFLLREERRAPHRKTPAAAKQEAPAAIV
jgi:uncharacterized membrane protein YgdD (TMEM256/DUF423 family)